MNEIIRCTSLSNFSQHPVGGTLVIGGDDPNTEVFAAWHSGDRTAVGGGGAVEGFSSVPLCLNSVGERSRCRVPGCDQHLRVTLSRCLYVRW